MDECEGRSRQYGPEEKERTLPKGGAGKLGREKAHTGCPQEIEQQRDQKGDWEGQKKKRFGKKPIGGDSIQRAATEGIERPVVRKSVKSGRSCYFVGRGKKCWEKTKRKPDRGLYNFTINLSKRLEKG